MGSLEGKVAIITGAGGGLGREHALLFAEEGARIVVNDLGGDSHGTTAGSTTPAQETVAMIQEMGGEAVVNGANVADWAGAAAMVQQAATQRSTGVPSRNRPKKQVVPPLAVQSSTRRRQVVCFRTLGKPTTVPRSRVSQR